MKIFGYALIGFICITFIFGLNVWPIATCGDHVAASISFLLIVAMTYRIAKEGKL
jgi:hypothetical protein